MNDSFARGDLRALARTCNEEQFERLRQRIRARPGGQTIVWGKEGEGRADIVGVRTVDAWQSKKPEDHCTQALVRFDTRQVSPSVCFLSWMGIDYAGSRSQCMDQVGNFSRETRRNSYPYENISSSRRKIGSPATGCSATNSTLQNNYANPKVLNLGLLFTRIQACFMSFQRINQVYNPLLTQPPRHLWPDPPSTLPA